MTPFYLTMAFVYLLVVVLELLMPSFVRPSLPFGVRIPEEHANDAVIAEERRTYRLLVFLASVVVAGLTAAIAVAVGQPLVITGGLFVMLAVFWVIYYRAHRRLRAIKAREGWYMGMRQGVVVETTLRTEPTTVPWLWAAPMVALLLLTVALGIWKYPSLPDTLTIHWNASGEPNGFAAKSVWSAFSLVFTQAFFTLLFAGLAAYIPRHRQELDVEHPEVSARQHRVYQREMAKGLLFLGTCVNVSMLFASLMIWGVLPASNPNMAIATVVPVIIGVLGLVVIMLRVGQAGFRARVGGSDERYDPDFVNRDDDRYWFGGIFYFNRDDPAFMVNKRFGIGRTLNFGHPGAWLFVVGVIGLVVVTHLLGIHGVFLGRHPIQ